MNGFIHYTTIGLIVGLPSLSVGLGEGIASMAFLKATTIQPKVRSDLITTYILGVAFIETAAVVGLTFAMMLLFDHRGMVHEYFHYKAIGIALALCLPGSIIGIASAFPVRQGCLSVARQPFFVQKIKNIMLLTQSLMQTPIIFAFLIALLIHYQEPTSYEKCINLISSGLCFGLGSIGPIIGLAYFAQSVCKSVGINRYAYNKLLAFTLISEALIESPLIFSFLISVILLQINLTKPHTIVIIAKYLASALCMGLGTIGPGISSGRTAARACSTIVFHPEQYGHISKTSIFGQIFIETSAIYALLIALMLLFM